jgi:hypothetical protein
LQETNPRLSRLRCDECQRYVYNIPAGTPETFEGASGEEKILRAAPPPCHECPKGSPDNDHLYQLSWKNHRAVTLYRRVRSGVMPIPPHLECCPLLADVFSAIDDVLQAANAELRGRELSTGIMVAMARSLSNVQR